jgi:hypothetical protein
MKFVGRQKGLSTLGARWRNGRAVRSPWEGGAKAAPTETRTRARRGHLPRMVGTAGIPPLSRGGLPRTANDLQVVKAVDELRSSRP